MADENNVFIETSSCGLIAVPLSADTCSIVTAVPSIITAGATTIAGAIEREEGTDFTAKGMNGLQCGPRVQGPSIAKWINITGTLCAANLALFSMLTGNPTIEDDDGNLVGYETLLGGASASSSVCTTAADKPKIALLIARKASDSDGGCSASASTSGMTGLMAHLFPLMTDFEFEDDTFEDARASYAFTAKAYSNPNIGRGPWNLYPVGNVPNKPSATSGHSRYFINPASFPNLSKNPVVHPTVVAPV